MSMAPNIVSIILFKTRGGKRPLGAPTLVKSAVNHARAYLQHFRPFSNASLLAAKFNDAVAFQISGLPFVRRPSAIIRRVIFRTVTSLNRGVLRAVPLTMEAIGRVHISLEGFKREPFIAHGDAHSAITGVRRAVLGKAPLFDAGPNLVEPEVLGAREASETVPEVIVLPQTRTGARLAGTQLASSYEAYLPAIALALPKILTRILLCTQPYRHQSAEPLTRDIFCHLLSHRRTPAWQKVPLCNAKLLMPTH